MIGAIADDLTGASDVASAFARAGLHTETRLFDAVQGDAPTVADVLVVDTESRHLPAPQAYQRVREAAGRLRTASFVYKKICSAFRGNIGAEVDAVMDGLELGFTCLVPAFPAQGRTTVGGRHYIRGVPLDQTEMAADPLCPMTDAFLPRVLRAQTKRRVHQVPAQDAVRLARARRQGGIAVLDAATGDDLSWIAEAIQGDRVACGASALAGEIAARLPRPELAPCPQGDVGALAAGRTLVVSGSASSVAQAQIAHAASDGARAVAVDANVALGPQAGWDAEAMRVARQIGGIQSGIACLFLPPTVEATQAAGAAVGLDPLAAGGRVANLLALCATRAIVAGGFAKLVIFGGSTSGAVFRALGMVGQRILAEVEPGVPSGLSIGDTRMLVVLKPGSFGQDDFVSQAERHLRSLEQ